MRAAGDNPRLDKLDAAFHAQRRSLKAWLARRRSWWWLDGAGGNPRVCLRYRGMRLDVALSNIEECRENWRRYLAFEIRSLRRAAHHAGR